jgi:hypothetical protein
MASMASVSPTWPLQHIVSHPPRSGIRRDVHRLPLGIVGWVTDALPDAFGITRIAVGATGAAAMRRLFPNVGFATLS